MKSYSRRRIAASRCGESGGRGWKTVLNFEICFRFWFHHWFESFQRIPVWVSFLNRSGRKNHFWRRVVARKKGAEKFNHSACQWLLICLQLISSIDHWSHRPSSPRSSPYPLTRLPSSPLASPLASSLASPFSYDPNYHSLISPKEKRLHKHQLLQEQCPLSEKERGRGIERVPATARYASKFRCCASAFRTRHDGVSISFTGSFHRGRYRGTCNERGPGDACQPRRCLLVTRIPDCEDRFRDDDTVPRFFLRPARLCR